MPDRRPSFDRDQVAAGPERDSPPRTPRWVKITGITALVLIALLVVLMLTGTGGPHGPNRHMRHSDLGADSLSIHLTTGSV